jgi:coatomer subunit beta
LESLKSVIIENVSHKHAYVRKNALLCIVSITNNFGVDVLPESLKTTLRDIVEKDSDITCKRNAYLALAKIDQKESFEVTYELLTNTDINEIGDLFLLSLVENLRNISLNFPNLKGRILKLFYDLANHKSHSVLFEVANSLITLSSNPNIIKVAVGIFCNLLVEQKDNNILIIILKKLMNIKNRYMDILEENILSFAIILNTTSNSEIRKLLFDLIIELLRESNICQVFDVFINDLNKLRGANDTDSNIQIKNMILNCIHKGLKRFPKTKETYAIYLLEKTILYNSKGTFIDEQINILKDLFYIFTDLRKDFIKKISQNFEDINNAQILQLIFWLVAEFIEDDLELIKKIYIMTMKNMGDLNFEVTNEDKNLTKKESENSTKEKKMITKTVILPDGTYGTKQIYLENSEMNKQKENKFLRNFILDTDFFFSTNMIMSLTRLIIKINKLDLTEKKEIYNTFFYNTINIICAILTIKSNKIFKDPHNISRINFCLECLISNELDLFDNIINESREVYNEYYSKLIAEDDNNFNKDNKIKMMVKNVDDYLNFRYVKNPELDGIEIDDDKCKNEDNYINSNSKFGSKNGNKFIEVITGSEVINILLLLFLFINLFLL